MPRLLLLMIILLALDVYAFQAIRSWLRPYGPKYRRVGYLIYGLLSLTALALILLNVFDVTAQWSKSWRVMARTFAFIFYLSKVPVALFVLVDDLRRGLTLMLNKLSPVTERDTSRSRFLSKAALVVGGVPLVTLSYGVVRNAYRYRRFAVDVPIRHLPAGLAGLKIVQISDMHSGSWTQIEPVKEAVRLINEEQPDVVCFTGDIVNNRADEMLPYVEIFREIKAKHGVFSTLGNHDYGDYERWPSAAAKEANMELLYDIHRRLGWELLRDEHRKLDINGHRLGILGVENWSALARFPKKGDLARAYGGTEDCDCRVLLSHDPTHWDAQVRPEFPDIHLTLSGHTHGFQFGVEIPGFRWSPAQYLYKQWAGLYRSEGQWLYVNRGLGFLGYPGRVGILPEVTVLTLRQATS